MIPRSESVSDMLYPAGSRTKSISNTGKLHDKILPFRLSATDGTAKANVRPVTAEEPRPTLISSLGEYVLIRQRSRERFVMPVIFAHIETLPKGQLKVKHDI